MVLRGESMDSPRDEKEIDAKDLISINRLDIIAKYKYVEDRLKNLNCKFFKTLYLKVIEAHTRGTFTSTEHQDKNSKEKFLQYFDNTIDSIVNNGFDYNISKLIIDKNGVIVNGGHRVAILAYLNQKVLLHYQENDIEVKDDTEDYRKRLLEDKYIDYLVSEYFRLTLKSKIIMSTKELDIENIFNVKLIYTKIIKFTDTGIENIQKITGIQNNIKKFRGTKKIYIYIIENNDIENDIEGQLKRNESILYYFSKKEEVSNMIYMLLNENTISFINYSKLNEDIRLYLTQIKEELIKRFNEKYPDDFRLAIAYETCKKWASGEIKMKEAKLRIIECHSIAKEIDDRYYIAICHAIGQGLSTIHVETHAIGLPIYELTAIVLNNKADYKEKVEEKIKWYIERLKYYEDNVDNINIKWADFLKKDVQNKEMKLYNSQKNTAK